MITIQSTSHGSGHFHNPDAGLSARRQCARHWRVWWLVPVLATLLSPAAITAAKAGCGLTVLEFKVASTNRYKAGRAGFAMPTPDRDPHGDRKIYRHHEITITDELAVDFCEDGQHFETNYLTFSSDYWETNRTINGSCDYTFLPITVLNGTETLCCTNPTWQYYGGWITKREESRTWVNNNLTSNYVLNAYLDDGNWVEYTNGTFECGVNPTGPQTETNQWDNTILDLTTSYSEFCYTQEGTRNRNETLSFRQQNLWVNSPGSGRRPNV